MNVDRVVDSWFAAVEALVTTAPGGHIEHREHGTRLLVSGARLASLNGVFSPSLEPDVDEIAALAATMPGLGQPWCIQLRGEPGPDVLKIAADHGLSRQSRSPLMVCRADEASFRSRAVSVRTVAGSEVETYNEVLTEGFEGPADLFGPLMSAPVLDGPGVTAYLAEDGGIPVATGLATHFAGLVGVFNIATPPPYRRHGYGRAVTEQILRGGFGGGASAAFLHASDAGSPLYESMGFTTVETWTYLISP